MNSEKSILLDCDTWTDIRYEKSDLLYVGPLLDINIGNTIILVNKDEKDHNGEYQICKRIIKDEKVIEGFRYLVLSV